ncbi:hypothetical protein VMCG_06271 [Cytospora schulzeri]|uniref:Uncharacterized protein n=1 Tax=Cytospora schulzeri TaxID=448051 RepID=A0A423W9D3_9PEZI|nr:hypothetical protein VMCG_06271 [Valsa malicola]
MSLTSLSGGYGYGPSRTPRLPPTPKQPIFYDYSEDFEDVTEPPPFCPIAPIPKRVSNPYRPMNIQKNCDTNAEGMDEAHHEFVAYLQEATMSELPEGNERHGNEQEGSPSDFGQRNDTVQTTVYNPVMEHDNGQESVLSSRDAGHAVDFDASTPRLSAERKADDERNSDELDDKIKRVNAELTSDSSTLDDPPQPETPAFTTNMPSREVVHCREDPPNGMHVREGHVTDHDVSSPVEILEEQLCSVASAPTGDSKPRQVDGTASLPHMSSNRCHDSRFYSLGSGLSDLASFVHQVDTHFQIPGPDSHVRHSVEAQNVAEGEARDESTIAPLEFSGGQRENDDKYLGEDARGITHPPRVSSLRQHRRHHAELRVNTGIVDTQQYQVISTRSGPTLVPQPISPAKILRVKNSIPRLMKALPPLPDYDPAPESPFGPTVAPMEFETFELSRLTDARSTLSDAVMSKGRYEEAPKSYESFVFEQKARKPKLKLRHAASYAQEQSRDLRRGYMNHGHETHYSTSEKRPATATEYSTAPVKRRLPIKISRPILTTFASEDTGTVKRRTGFEKSSTVSELASSQPVDLFSSSTGLHIFPKSTEPTSQRQISPGPPEKASAPVITVTRLSRTQEVALDDAGARGSSLDAHLDTLRLPNANNEVAAEGEMQSFFSDNSLNRERRECMKEKKRYEKYLREQKQQQKQMEQEAISSPADSSKPTPPPGSMDGTTDGTTESSSCLKNFARRLCKVASALKPREIFRRRGRRETRKNTIATPVQPPRRMSHWRRERPKPTPAWRKRGTEVISAYPEGIPEGYRPGRRRRRGESRSISPYRTRAWATTGSYRSTAAHLLLIGILHKVDC